MKFRFFSFFVLKKLALRNNIVRHFKRKIAQINFAENRKTSKKERSKMKKILKKPSVICSAVASVLAFAALLLCSYNIIIPDSVSCYAGEEPPEYFGARVQVSEVSCQTFSDGDADPITYTAQYKLFDAIPIKTVSVNVWKKTRVYPGGMTFGVKFFTDGVLVVGFAEMSGSAQNPAYAAGLRLRDVITAVNGKSISSAQELTDTVEKCGGNTVSVTYIRDGKEFTAKITPLYSKEEGKYKTGVFVRDSGAGIGTVTYIIPETGEFAGLGHGICDGETGALIPIKRGVVSDVVINGVVKGESGSPGEIKGYFKQGKTGTMIKNTDCGVYGIFAPCPSNIEPMEIGLKGEIQDGEAYILCTLDENSRIQKYSINISNINRNAEAGKCFTVKITDRALLEKTGGIVQGMSGSPIIQNGKLVGAVTHVMINDPTAGYGIFIENMLNKMGDLAR